MARITSVGTGSTLPKTLLEDDLLIVAKDFVTVVAANMAVINPDDLGYRESFEVLKKLTGPYETAYNDYAVSQLDYSTEKAAYKTAQNNYAYANRAFSTNKLSASEKRMAIAIEMTRILAAITDMYTDTEEQQATLDARLNVLEQAGWAGGQLKAVKARQARNVTAVLLYGAIYKVDWNYSATSPVPSDPEIWYVYLDGTLLIATSQTEAQVQLPDGTPAGNHSITVTGQNAFGSTPCALPATITVA